MTRNDKGDRVCGACVCNRSCRLGQSYPTCDFAVVSFLLLVRLYHSDLPLLQVLLSGIPFEARKPALHPNLQCQRSKYLFRWLRREVAREGSFLSRILSRSLLRPSCSLLDSSRVSRSV